MLDTEQIYDRAMILAGSQIGRRLNEQFLQKARGTNSKLFEQMLLEEYGTEFPFEQFRNLYRELFWNILDEEGVKIKAGFWDLVEYLEFQSIPICLATSSVRDMAEYLLKKAGIEQIFQNKICGNQVLNGKPNPEVYCKAAELLGVDTKQCLVLEDSENGIKAGHAAGCYTIMIPDQIQPDREIQKLCSCVFPDLGMVIEYLKKFKDTDCC